MNFPLRCACSLYCMFLCFKNKVCGRFLRVHFNLGNIYYTKKISKMYAWLMSNGVLKEVLQWRLVLSQFAMLFFLVPPDFSLSLSFLSFLPLFPVFPFPLFLLLFLFLPAIFSSWPNFKLYLPEIEKKFVVSQYQQILFIFSPFVKSEREREADQWFHTIIFLH